jgi:hypothetical protein
MTRSPLCVFPLWYLHSAQQVADNQKSPYSKNDSDTTQQAVINHPGESDEVVVARMCVRLSIVSLADECLRTTSTWPIYYSGVGVGFRLCCFFTRKTHVINRQPRQRW